MALLNIIPTDRYEKFLARMAGDGSVPMPIPRDKKEKFMKAIAENINRGGAGVDLTEYAEKTYVDNKLAGYATKEELQNLPSGGGTDVELENTPIDFSNWESEVDV